MWMYEDSVLRRGMESPSLLASLSFPYLPQSVAGKEEVEEVLQQRVLALGADVDPS